MLSGGAKREGNLVSMKTCTPRILLGNGTTLSRDFGPYALSIGYHLTSDAGLGRRQ